MAKLARKNQKLFGGGVPASGNLAQYGSLAAGNPNYTNDPEAIQALPAFDGAWSPAVVGNKSPAMQDMNALQFNWSYQIAYMLQRGIPEWKADQDYYLSSFCVSGQFLYRSLVDGHTGKPVTDTNYWEVVNFRAVGPTTNRPANPPLGFVYLDTTIGVEIMWLNSDWTTTSGSPGDVKEVDAPTLDEALTRSPGWDFHSKSVRRVIACADPSTPATYGLGKTTGAETVSLTADQNGPHFHTAQISLHARSGSQADFGDGGSQTTYSKSISTNNSGNGDPHNNMQPTIYLWRLVKR